MFRLNIPKESGIYKIISITNGKIYVGSAVNLKGRLFQGHLWSLKRGNHDNSRLQNHCNKYGITDLEFHVIEFCPKENLIVREQYYIDTLHLFDENKKPLGFNISPTAGSQIGMVHSEKSRAKMKESHKNRTDEMNKHHGEMIKGEKNPMYKHVYTKQTLDKMSNSHKGVYPSEETRKKKSVAMMGKTWKRTPETNKKQSETLKNRIPKKCPFCEYESSNYSNMTRYHFDNCKNKPSK